MGFVESMKYINEDFPHVNDRVISFRRLAAFYVCFCRLFHSTHSTSFTPDPPKQSSALPIVRSTFPPLSFLTSSKSSTLRPPPAYVTGMLHHCDSLTMSSSSTPRWRPSLSAAWIRNSQQKGSSCFIVSGGSSQLE